jgi:benzodiazapine receptor
MATVKRNLLIAGNIAGFILMFVVNILSNALPINGMTAGDLSDAIPNLFVPAGYVFSIWGLIYILLGMFTVAQAIKGFLHEDTLERVSFWFILSNIFNAAWLFFWHYELIGLSLLAMFALFASILMIYLRLRVGLEDVSKKEAWFARIPFSVYLGWITVATVANITAFLVTIGWNGFGISEPIWAVITIVTAALIAALILLKRKDYAYALVPVWAFGGIAVKQAGSVVAYTAIAAGALLLIYIAFLLFTRKKA